MELRSSQCKKCVINALTFLEFVIKAPSIKFLVVESRDTGFHLDQFICVGLWNWKLITWAKIEMFTQIYLLVPATESSQMFRYEFVQDLHEIIGLSYKWLFCCLLSLSKCQLTMVEYWCPATLSHHDTKLIIRTVRVAFTLM